MKDDAPRRVFMCGIDWQHHLAGDGQGTTVYPTEDAVRANKSCVRHGGCGIVEADVRFVRWVEQQNLKDDGR